MTVQTTLIAVLVAAGLGAAAAGGVQQLRIKAERAEHVAELAGVRAAAQGEALAETQRLIANVQQGIQTIAPLRAEQEEAYANLASLLAGVRADTSGLREQSSATARAISHLSHESAKQAASACTALLAEMAALGTAMAFAIGESADAADGHYADDAEKVATWPRNKAAPSLAISEP